MEDRLLAGAATTAPALGRLVPGIEPAGLYSGTNPLVRPFNHT